MALIFQKAFAYVIPHVKYGVIVPMVSAISLTIFLVISGVVADFGHPLLDSSSTLVHRCTIGNKVAVSFIALTMFVRISDVDEPSKTKNIITAR